MSSRVAYYICLQNQNLHLSIFALSLTFFFASVSFIVAEKRSEYRDGCETEGAEGPQRLLLFFHYIIIILYSSSKPSVEYVLVGNYLQNLSTRSSAILSAFIVLASTF